MSRLRIIVARGIAVAAVAAPAVADAQPAAAIATDRPSVSASSSVVPSGALQLESGATETASQGAHTFDGPEILVRFGLTSQTELRVTVPNYLSQTGDGSVSGAADVAIGVKQQILRGGRLDIALIVSLSLPSGANAVSSHGYDPTLQVPWSRALSAGWTVGGMFSLSAPTQDDRRNVTGEATFLFDRQLTARWNGFVEYVGDFPQQGGARHLLHVGPAFKPTRWQQLDLHAGIGLSDAAADWLIGAGYSFRVP